MNLLVTGGAGFLGRHLVRRAVEAGHRTTSLDRAEADVVADIADRTAIEAALKSHRIDAIVHLATLLTDTSASDPVEGTRVNAVGTAAVFEAARRTGVRRVIYASSQAALGGTVEKAGDDAPLRPLTVYGATKAYGEHLAAAFKTMAPELALTGLRFGYVYGPHRDRGWRELQQMIEHFAEGHAEVRWPDFSQPIDWTYVDDAADAILATLAVPRPSRPVYNVCGDFRRIADAVAHLRRRFPAVRAVAYPAQFPPAAWDYRADGIEAELGFKPRVKLEEGIDRLADWLRGVNSQAGRR
ncbi:MAG: NAD(P)-dependent oxidoreductase [Alphaproteobacteria bacterium]|nr:NAD(P)-dependent oxidoreductase [Alphaproteobacteria bacterium]